MRHQRNVNGLRQNAQKKREEAFHRTEEAIKQLIKDGRPVNFKTVAEIAEVSTAWLYKEPDIKSRIEHLREQGTRKQKLVPQEQKATDASKDAKYQALKKRLQEVEAVNRGLREHLEAIHGRQRVLADENETQRQEIERLIKLLAGAKAEIEMIKSGSNKSLLPSSQSIPKKSSTKSNITSLASKRSKGEVSNTIRDELDALGIKLNSTLASKIQNSSEEAVLTAIAALKEQLQTTVVRSPGGWLSTALDDNVPWEPNQPLGQETDPADLFSEWYDLAREFGLVIASRREDDGSFWVQESTRQWVSFTEISSKWTTKYLKSRVGK